MVTVKNGFEWQVQEQWRERRYKVNSYYQTMDWNGRCRNSGWGGDTDLIITVKQWIPMAGAGTVAGEEMRI